MWTALKAGTSSKVAADGPFKPYLGKPAVRNFRGGGGNPKLDEPAGRPFPTRL